MILIFRFDGGGSVQKHLIHLKQIRGDDDTTSNSVPATTSLPTAATATENVSGSGSSTYVTPSLSTPALPTLQRSDSSESASSLETAVASPLSGPSEADAGAHDDDGILLTSPYESDSRSVHIDHNNNVDIKQLDDLPERKHNPVFLTHRIRKASDSLHICRDKRPLDHLGDEGPPTASGRAVSTESEESGRASKRPRLHS